MPKQKPTLNAADIELLKRFFASSDDIKRLEEKISHLPTKDEFYAKEDELVTELKALRQEVAISNLRSSENRDRLEKIENHVSLA